MRHGEQSRSTSGGWVGGCRPPTHPPHPSPPQVIGPNFAPDFRRGAFGASQLGPIFFLRPFTLHYLGQAQITIVIFRNFRNFRNFFIVFGAVLYGTSLLSTSLSLCPLPLSPSLSPLPLPHCLPCPQPLCCVRMRGCDVYVAGDFFFLFALCLHGQKEGNENFARAHIKGTVQTMKFRENGWYCQCHRYPATCSVG